MGTCLPGKPEAVLLHQLAYHLSEKFCMCMNVLLLLLLLFWFCMKVSLNFKSRLTHFLIYTVTMISFMKTLNAVSGNKKDFLLMHHRIMPKLKKEEKVTLLTQFLPHKVLTNCQHPTGFHPHSKLECNTLNKTSNWITFQAAIEATFRV
jgi:hypothetical protein